MGNNKMKSQFLFGLMMITSIMHAGFFEKLYKNESAQVSYIISQSLRERNPSSCPNVSVSKLQASQDYQVSCNDEWGLYNPLTKKLKLDNQLIDLSNIVSRLDTFIQKQKEKVEKKRRRSALTQAAVTYFFSFPKLFADISLRPASEDIDDGVAMRIEYKFDNERKKYDMWYVPDCKENEN